MGKQKPQGARDRLPVGEQAEKILHRERTERLGRQILQDLETLYDKGRKIADHINEGREINGQLMDQISDLYGRVDQLQQSTESLREVFSDAEIADLKKELTAFEDWIDALDKQANALLATMVERTRVETKEGADAFNHIINLDYWHKNINSHTPFGPEERANVLLAYLDGKLTRQELSEFVYKKQQDAFFKLVDELHVTPEEHDSPTEVSLPHEPIVESPPLAEFQLKLKDRYKTGLKKVAKLEKDFARQHESYDYIARLLAAEESMNDLFAIANEHLGDLKNPEAVFADLQALGDRVNILKEKAERSNQVSRKVADTIEQPLSFEAPKLAVPETIAPAVTVTEAALEVVELPPENDAGGMLRRGDQLATILEDMLKEYPGKHQDLPMLVKQFGDSLDVIKDEFKKSAAAQANTDTLLSEMRGIRNRFNALRGALVRKAAEKIESQPSQQVVETPSTVTESNEAQVVTAEAETEPATTEQPNSGNREVTTPIPSEPRIEVKPSRKKKSLIGRQPTTLVPVLAENRVPLEPKVDVVGTENRESPKELVEQKPVKRRTTPVETWTPNKTEQQVAAGKPRRNIRAERFERTEAWKGASPADYRPANYEETKTFGDRLGHGLGYLLSRGREAAEAASMAAEPKISRAVAMAAGLFGAMKSAANINILPDVVRYLPDRYFSSKEKQELQQMALEMNSYAYLTNNPEIAAREGKRFAKKRDELLARIKTSRFLTEENRSKLITEVGELETHYKTAKTGPDQAYNRVLAESISDNLAKRKVGGEAGESAVAVALGKYLGRGIRGVTSIVERLRGLTHENGDGERAKETVRGAVVDGFVSHWKRVEPQGLTWRKAAAGAVETPRERARQVPVALRRLLRNVGIAVIALGANPEKLDAATFHAQVGNLLAAHEAAAESHLNKTISLEGDASIASALPEIKTGQVTVPEEEISAIEIPADFAEAVVKKKDGITYPLSRYILRNPHLYGFKGADDEVARKKFATNFAVHIAQNDGLLYTWLTSQAVNNIGLIPIERADGWHVGFVDVASHNLIEGNALKPYLEKERKRVTITKTKPGV